ncbi:MAG: MFS transporter [Bacteroidaceae bacterium]|nr:MFS transporter [Bacteroidaceae bacterium]
MLLKFRLTILNFLEFAVWGAYLTSMGTYLAGAGLATNIGWFYSMQGVVSIFMPALMGMLADRKIEGQKVLSMCHAFAGLFMIAASAYAYNAGDAVQFGPLFALYSLSVAFFMPTIALSYSVAYSALEGAGYDSVKAFPPIRVWGTVGFIVTMWVIDLTGLQATPGQWMVSGALSLVMAAYSLTMPRMPIKENGEKKSVAEALGLNAFKLFLNPRMAMFFIFAMLLGVCLQITNGFANPFITSFGSLPEYADTFGVQHANILISLSQMSETLCILLIPFFLSKFGIKRVVLIALFAWVLRFGFFGLGNPGSGVWLFILSMIVYGVAFDFFNISGSLFVNQETDESIRSSAQGLFMMMTNGFGACIGTIVAQQIINHYVYFPQAAGATGAEVIGGWQTCWFIFAAYALVVFVAFLLLFKDSKKPIDVASVGH